MEHIETHYVAPVAKIRAFGEGWFAPVAADARVNTCRNYAGVWIQLCNHPEHTAEDCPYHKHY